MKRLAVTVGGQKDKQKDTVTALAVVGYVPTGPGHGAERHGEDRLDVRGHGGEKHTHTQ